jgi:hypothetical protein
MVQCSTKTTDQMVGRMSEHMYTALQLTEEGGEILSLRRALPFAWQRSNLLYNSFDVLELALVLYVVW